MIQHRLRSITGHGAVMAKPGYISRASSRGRYLSDYSLLNHARASAVLFPPMGLKESCVLLYRTPEGEKNASPIQGFFDEQNFDCPAARSNRQCDRLVQCGYSSYATTASLRG